MRTTKNTIMEKIILILIFLALLSCRKTFAHLTDFNWIDYWGLMEDKETYETIFSEDGDILGTKEVVLQNPSIFVGIDEGGGGLITFKNGKYEWIYQAD